MSTVKKQKSVLLVLAGALLWGTYGSFVTQVSRMGLGQNALVFLRFLFTAVPIFFFLIFTGRGEDLRIRKKDIPLFLANGIVSIVFFTSCYTAAIRYTKIATAAALLYTAPAIVLLLSALLFHEKLTGRKIVCVIAAIAGCALCSGIAGGAGLTTMGLLLGLGAGLGYALYSIFSRLLQNRGYSTLTNIVYTFGIATLVYFFMACCDKSVIGIWKLPVASLLAGAAGILTGCFAYLCYTEGMKGMKPSNASVIATIEPVASAILGAVIFHQTLSFVESAGIILVVGSVIAMNVGEKEKTEKG